MSLDPKTVELQIRTLLEAQIIQALNSAPEAIEKMVKAAIEDQVDSRSGTRDGYGGNRVPYLEYMLGEEIRSAARRAVVAVLKTREDEIFKQVENALKDTDVVGAITKSLLRAGAEEWRIDVKFESQDRR